MPAASRRIEPRPSAATISRAESAGPALVRNATSLPPGSAPVTSASSIAMPSCRARSSSAGMSSDSGMFQPNASSPISAESKMSSGALTADCVSSTMRRRLRGTVAWRKVPGHRPMVSSSRIDGCISATVRGSSPTCRWPISARRQPSPARRHAVARPAGPRPATMMSNSLTRL